MPGALSCVWMLPHHSAGCSYSSSKVGARVKFLGQRESRLARLPPFSPLLANTPFHAKQRPGLHFFLYYGFSLFIRPCSNYSTGDFI